jgi:hypothetical protein
VALKENVRNNTDDIPFQPRISMKIIVYICLLALSACSVVKASNQEEAKDLSVLKLYNSQSQIVGGIGSPASSAINALGFRVDTYAFTNGYNAAVRASRTLGHAVADVGTLGLWEIVGTPIESGFNGSKVNGQVVYNLQDRAIKIQFYDDGKDIVDETAPEYYAAANAASAAPAPQPLQPQSQMTPAYGR